MSLKDCQTEATPCGPCGPAGPCGPERPATPEDPAGPAGPAGPAAPAGAAGPVGPYTFHPVSPPIGRALHPIANSAITPNNSARFIVSFLLRLVNCHLWLVRRHPLRHVPRRLVCFLWSSR